MSVMCKGKLMRRRFVLAVVLMSVSSAAGAESWVCVGDLATGFTYNKRAKHWATTAFTADRKYVISPVPKDPLNKAKYLVKVMGDDLGIAGCYDDFANWGQLQCSGTFEFIFNRRTGRFLAAHTLGYVTDTLPERFAAQGEDEPLMEIGTCATIDVGGK